MNYYKEIQALAPEIASLVDMRLSILQVIDREQIIGRKSLAQKINLSERVTRSQVEVLRNQHLVNVSPSGIELTDEGRRIYQILNPLLSITYNSQCYQLQEQLKAKLGIAHCVVVPGDAGENPAIFDELGKAVVQVLGDYLPVGDNTIAVTGGTTLSKVAYQFDLSLAKNRQLTFVPSRGGLGQEIDIQSNSVGNVMAQRTSGSYIPLFIPENITLETSKILMNDEEVASIVAKSKNADCLILSVGTAKVMAERRKINSDKLNQINDYHAVGEAFGAFYNRQGEIVASYPRIGLKFKDLEQIPLVITVVAGEEKADAVEGFFHLAPRHSWLICDEAIALKILNGETL